MMAPVGYAVGFRKAAGGKVLLCLFPGDYVDFPVGS